MHPIFVRLYPSCSKIVVGLKKFGDDDSARWLDRQKKILAKIKLDHFPQLFWVEKVKDCTPEKLTAGGPQNDGPWKAGNGTL